VALESGWDTPPLEARTRCWWWWLNGNVTQEAITRDLEEMHRQGLGGANIIDAGGAQQGGNRRVPHGPDFASPAWRELFLHALREADRLGLQLGFNIQSGWNLGGPTVTPRDAAKRLAFTTIDVTGGRLVDQRLRRPRSTGGYYRDVALLAIALPEQQDAELAELHNWRAKAYFQYPGGFTAVDASHLLTVMPADADCTAVDPAAVVELSAMLDGDGRLRWDAPPGRWRLLRMGYTLSGARVSTHSDGWEGWAIDYLDSRAFDRYWRQVIDPLLAAAGPLIGRSLKFLHTDSWELGPVNWTPKLPAQFRRLRGYDMQPYLPVLAGYVVTDVETSTRFLNDFRRTLGDLIAEGKYATFSRYAHRVGLGIHPESGGPHAAPVDALLCLGRSDIPMGEFWARAETHRVEDFKRFFTKQPASAAHVYGQRLVLAESFTTIGPHWEEDPRDLKPEFDRGACEGLNLVMLHTFDCSPAEMGTPGQVYFAGTHINPQITWWRQAHAFFDYLNRCQFLLQQGLPAADVLYFYGENVPSFVRLKRDDPAAVLPDYDYDVINLEALVQRTRAENGRVVLPDGVRYEVLVLPPPDSYGLAALEHIARLGDGGARVVGPRPTRPIGLSASPTDELKFRTLVDRLWPAEPRPGAPVVHDVSARDALIAAGIGPELSYDAAGDVELDFIHRRSTEGDVYFVVNRRDRPVDVEASFRMVHRQPELWDPVTGRRGDAGAFRQEAGRTIVPLSLPAYGSVFVVLRRPIAAEARGPDAVNSLRLESAVNIDGPWTVAFDPEWGGPPSARFEHLDDWSTRPEDSIRFYSGTAAYRTHFDLPPRGAEQRLFLDLGRVANLASVSVNGQALGVVWTDPFRIEITSAARPGRNELAIEVTNLWPNRLIGDSRLPPAERRTHTNAGKFQADSPLMPSGLLGPVVVLQTPTAEAAADRARRN
ncbi:MAG TPA: glycosyl hydrolase, partial [Lacipirellulaceae bacterium]|nr:glycosyl hydrolase [Lacipirellulaceae bacterium]